MNIRHKEYTDRYISDTLLCVEEFIKESGYELTYSYKNSIDYITGLIMDESCGGIVIYLDNEVAGFATFGYDTEFHNERFGYLMKFYVRKQYRGTTVGRKLIEEITKWFDANNCIESFATSTAAIGEDQQYVNLLSKYGYSTCGRTLKRGIHV